MTRQDGSAATRREDDPVGLEAAPDGDAPDVPDGQAVGEEHAADPELPEGGAVDVDRRPADPVASDPGATDPAATESAGATGARDGLVGTEAAEAGEDDVAGGSAPDDALASVLVREPDEGPAPADPETVVEVRGLTKRYGSTLAVDAVDLDVSAGSFFGIVGPNGAGKTTTLSMVTGLLRPDSGRVRVHGIDVWADPDHAKRTIGVLPDGLRLFDRLTGAQLLFYAGVLRGLSADVVRQRAADLIDAFALGDAAARLVADYSAGMTKKIALAAAMIHAPRVLVLDEPFESVDPVSSANLVEILQRYVASGGTVVLSSHGMDLIQRVCDHVAIVVGGRVLAAGTVDEVRDGRTLEDRFVQLAGGRRAAAGMEWLHSFTE